MFTPILVATVGPLLLWIAARILWSRSSRWIPFVLGVTAITTFLLIILIFLALNYSTNKSFGYTALLLLPFVELLFITALPIVLLGIAMQINGEEIQYDVYLSPETKKPDTNEAIKIDTNIEGIEEEGIIEVYCPKCRKVLKVPQIYLLNSGKCKFCSTEFIPYENV